MNNSILKNTYSPLSIIPRLSADNRMSLTAFGEAQTTITGKEKKLTNRVI